MTFLHLGRGWGTEKEEKYNYQLARPENLHQFLTAKAISSPLAFTGCISSPGKHQLAIVEVSVQVRAGHYLNHETMVRADCDFDSGEALNQNLELRIW